MTRETSELVITAASLQEEEVATPTGFEPAIFAVTGRRVSPLHHGAMLAMDRNPRLAPRLSTSPTRNPSEDRKQGIQTSDLRPGVLLPSSEQAPAGHLVLTLTSKDVLRVGDALLHCQVRADKRIHVLVVAPKDMAISREPKAGQL